MNANSTMLTPIVGETVPVWAVSRIAATAASSPESANADGDDGVGPDPEHAGHPEVLRRGPHLRAQGRAPEEQPDHREQGERDADGDDVELLDRDLRRA